MMRAKPKTGLTGFPNARNSETKVWLSDPSCAPLLGPGGDRKITPGITGSSRARAPIDPAVWYLDVGFSYPGSAAGAKGEAARLLKGNMSWV